MVPTLIQKKFNGDFYFFCFPTEPPFCSNLVLKIKIDSLSLNLVPKLIPVCRNNSDVHFCSFLAEKPFLDKFSPDNQKF